MDITFFLCQKMIKYGKRQKKEMSKQTDNYDIKMLIPILSSLMGALATKVLSGI